MKRSITTLSSLMVLMLCSTLTSAHHSFSAQYDRDDTVAIDGIITKVEWTNPHAHFYVNVVEGDGSVTNWNLELASPNMLIRNGWKRDSLAADDHIMVSASRSRDGTPTAAVVLITRDDGSELTFISGSD